MEAAQTPDLPEEPDISHLVTEDDEPAESFYQDKQMRILADGLETSWPQGRPFVLGCDVGIFNEPKPGIAPDFFLSVGVERPPDNHREKKNRSYFIWRFGKPPDIVIEVVSNREGGELTSKRERYCNMRIPYYVVYDPGLYLGSRSLRVFEMSGASYIDKVDRFFPEFGLGLTVWRGSYGGETYDYLRWTDSTGTLLAVGQELVGRAEAERERAQAQQERAEAEHQRAQAEHQRAEAERERAERLAARLRELGEEV